MQYLKYALLISCAIASTTRADELPSVATSVKVFQEDGHLYLEVNATNNGNADIELHRLPSHLLFADQNKVKSVYDPETNRGELELRSISISFRNDTSTVKLRPGETFGKRIDIAKRIELRASRYSVTASWSLDKDIPPAKQTRLDIK